LVSFCIEHSGPVHKNNELFIVYIVLVRYNVCVNSIQVNVFMNLIVDLVHKNTHKKMSSPYYDVVMKALLNLQKDIFKDSKKYDDKKINELMDTLNCIKTGKNKELNSQVFDIITVKMDPVRVPSSLNNDMGLGPK
jgi:hypothetical protein